MKHYLVAASAVGIAASAFATVSTTLVADRYVVIDGAKTYSVLDVYVKGNHSGDVMSSVTGLNGTAGHEVVFATSKAAGVTRDSTTGKINGGAITGDVFVQAGNSSWNPTYGGTEAWDSFIASGNRKQNAKATNRAGTLIDYKSSTWGTSTTFGGGQMNTANSNFIENGGGSGWLNTLGSNPYLSGTAAIMSENPFARVSLYNSTWNSTYADLDRTGVLTSKGGMYNGAASAGAALSATATSGAGSSLDFMWMVGRFAVDVTSEASPITMQVQFNMVGRNGTANETGTIFTGASTASYKVSQFFQFEAVPTPGAIAILSVAGLIGRRRSH
ncbi:MAG: hypothetical protein ACKPEA_04600 [Planctomycetota bacterium]